MDTYERVHEYLSRLGLSTIENTIDSYLELSHGKPVMEILDHLLSDELKHKVSKKTENMLNWSGFPFRKTVNDFDFTFQPSIDRAVIDELMTMRFQHNTENVVFLGPPGCWKDASVHSTGDGCNHVRYTCILHICCKAGADTEEGLRSEAPGIQNKDIFTLQTDDSG